MRPVGMRRPDRSLPRCSAQWPAVGSLRPAMMRSSVLLPHPDGPSRLRNSPRATERSTPSSACSPDAKPFATPCTMTIGSEIGSGFGPVSGGTGSELPDNPDKTQRQQHKTEQLGRGQAFAKEAPRDEIAEI